jgi:hypothetical protein
LELISKSRDASPTPVIASIPLMIRLRITCCSWTRSPWISGKPSAKSVRTETPCFTASPRVSSTTSRIAALRLGVPASTLESRIKALQIDKRRFKPG